MIKNLKFTKEATDRWFVDLPEWKGEKADLEMVMGADTMLDYMSQGENEIVLFFSTEPFLNYKYKLTFKEEIYEGASYDLKGDHIELEVWLCFVTKFVFEDFPRKLYIY